MTFELRHWAGIPRDTKVTGKEEEIKETVIHVWIKYVMRGKHGNKRYLAVPSRPAEEKCQLTYQRLVIVGQNHLIPYRLPGYLDDNKKGTTSMF